VASAAPDLVYCAFGSPKEQEIADALAPEFPGTWWLGCGISLSFVAGELRRAPAFMQRAGLEWLHRMAQEPARLAERYLGRNLPFLAQLLTRQLIRRDVVR
jgi:N-acetylglucosaminyldiphosphoundecaprenol N-acetyl-beta-D-mannosaminyltransferase